jgi:RNA polymerase sigma-70 factor (ECF subfamily)
MHNLLDTPPADRSTASAGDEALCQLTDAALVERLRGSDFDALGILFDRYYPQIYRTAAGITHDSAAAEDIAQDVFLRLHQYAHRIDTALPLPPWLYRVTVNLSYTWVSRRQKRRISLEDLVDQIISPPTCAPDHQAEFSEVQAIVRGAIRDLNVQQRVVIVLHYLTGLSLEEIAEVLDLPLGTVKSRLHYARENLRRRLGDAFRVFDPDLSSGSAHGYASVLG